MTFRGFFLIPLTSETPTDKIKHGGSRRFVDQGDREFELISYNQHPYQLLTYQMNNKELQERNEAQELRNAGETPLEDQIMQYFEQRVAAEQQELGSGQRISYDRWVEIMGDAVRKYNAEVNRPGSGTDVNGNYTDFLENRRPFDSPTNDGVTH